LTWPAPIQFALDLTRIDLDLRRTTVDHHTNAAAVRLAKSGNAEELTKSASHETTILNQPGESARWIVDR
jgi:hypothetical protein